jgi:hypothetical protein
MIIGSQAILYHFPDFPRKPKDVDIIKNMYIEEHMSDLRVEWLENTVLQNWFTKPIEVCTPNELYTLKISHCFWDLENGSWNKHIWDIQWLKEKGCKFIPELFEQLYEYWNTIHGKNKRSNLDMSGEDFFNNALTFPIEHDYLHELLIKHEYFQGQSYPTYKFVLKDNAEVDVDQEKWGSLTHKQKYNLLFEEVSVMSLERQFHKDYRISYHRMLDKFIRNHAPLWEALWIIENYKECLKPAFNYKEFLNKQIQNEYIN